MNSGNRPPGDAAALRRAAARPAARPRQHASPLAIMLATMRWAHEEAEAMTVLAATQALPEAAATQKAAMGLRALALRAANDAAPYRHLRRVGPAGGRPQGPTHEDILAELARDEANARTAGS